MAIDKAVDSAVLDAGLTVIANAIREKAGTEGALAFPDAMADAIAAIEAGGELQEKTVTPSTELQEVTPDEGYYGLSKVVVEAVESGGSGGGGDLFDSSASGRIPDYDRGYADSVLSGMSFTSNAVGVLM